MADFPYLPLWTDAFLADTVHLDNRESGAYLLLLISSWRLGGSLPNDDIRLARYAKCTKREWARIKSVVLPFWSVDEKGGLFQKRLEAERKYVSDKSAKARSAAQAKWLKEQQTRSADASPKQMQNGHSASALIPTPTESLSENLTVAGRGAKRDGGDARATPKFDKILASLRRM